MKKQALLLPIAFLLTLTAARSQTQAEWHTHGLGNACFWAALSGPQKTSYIVGFIEATACAFVETDPKGTGPTVTARLLSDVSKTTFGEWQDSVDAFYLEPMNRAIPIQDAIFWVGLKASGKPEDALKSFEAQLRANAQKGQ